MNIFFDTSAIVKYFHIEDGTEQVAALIQKAGNEIWLSELAKVEFVSAVYRKYREGIIDDQKLELALEGFEADYAEFHIEPLGPPVTAEAVKLLKKYGKSEGLRTLDALHLASFNLLAEESWQFVAADKTLCRTASKEGHSVLNPMDSK